MAYALVAHTFFKGAPNGGTTPPIDTTGANLIILNTSPNDVGGPTTPFDSFGNTYTLIISENMLQAYSQLWYCYNPIVGPLHTFSSVSATTNFMGISAAAFSGSTANPFNQATGQDGRPPNPPQTGSMQPGPLTPGVDNCLFAFGFSGDIQTGTQVIDSGFTITDSYLQQSFVCLSGGLAYLIQTTAATENPTLSVTGWVGGGLAVTMATFFSHASPPPPPAKPPWSDFNIWAMRATAISHLPITTGMNAASASASAAALSVSISTSSTTLGNVSAGGVASPITVQSSTNTSVNLSTTSAGTIAIAGSIQLSASPGLSAISAGTSAAVVSIITGGLLVHLGNVSASSSAAAVTPQITALNVSLTSVSSSASAAAVSVTTGGTALITTFVLKNDTAGTQTSPFTSWIFGHGFKKGDIPAGTYPQFKIGNVTLAFSMGVAGVRAYWNDGSLRWAPFMLNIPAGNNVAASASLSIGIYNNGTAPTPSGRGASDLLSGGHDPWMEFDIASGGTGTYLAKFSDGAGSALTYMDGGAGWVGRVYAQAKKSGIADPQLGTYFYCAALQNSVGGFAGSRICPRVIQPWLDVGTKQMRMFSRLQLTDNGSLVFDPWASSPSKSPITFSWSDNLGPNSCSRFNVSSIGPGGVGLNAGSNYGGFGCILSTTNTLPLNLSPNTPYFYRYSGTAGKLCLSNDSRKSIATSVSPGAGFIIGSNAGIGTHTLTPLPFVCWAGSGYAVPTNGIWNYVQGAGTVATDCVCRGIPNKAYLHSTRLIPPYDTTIGANTQAAIPYVFNGINPDADPSLGSTGDRPDIGPQNNWSALYLVNQDAGSETQIRVNGLTDGHNSTCLRDSTTGTLINGGNDNAYTNIPQPKYANGTTVGGSTFRWAGANTSIPDAPTVNYQSSWSEWISPHLSNWSYIPALITGEPQYLDQVMERANSTVYNRLPTVSTSTVNQYSPSGGNKNFIVNAIPYQGTSTGTGDNLRGDAWGLRDIACAVALAGSSYYDGADYKSFFTDCLNNSFDSINAWRTMLTPGYALTNGIFGYEVSGRGAEWQDSFMRYACCMAIGMCECSGASTLLDMYLIYPGKMWDYAHAAGNPASAFNLGGYHKEVRLSTTVYPSDYIDTDLRLGGSLGITLSFTNGSSNITYAQAGHVGANYTMNVGDHVFFYGGDTPNPPSIFTFDTTCYVVSSSGSTIQLSFTPGGTPIVANATVSGVPTMGFSFFNAVHSTCASAAPVSYYAILAGALNWATALGKTVNPGLLAEMNDQLAYQKANLGGYNPQVTPKYTFGQSF